MASTLHFKKRRSGNTWTQRHRPRVMEGHIDIIVINAEEGQTSIPCSLSMKKKQRWLIQSGNIVNRMVGVNALIDDFLPKRSSHMIIAQEASAHRLNGVQSHTVLRRSLSSESLQAPLLFQDYQMLDHKKCRKAVINANSVVNEVLTDATGETCIRVTSTWSRPEVISQGFKSLQGSNKKRMVAHDLLDEVDALGFENDNEDSAEEEEKEEYLWTEQDTEATAASAFYRQPMIEVTQKSKIVKKQKQKKNLHFPRTIIQEEDYSEEEISLQEQTQTILGLENIEFNVQTVRTNLSGWSCRPDHLRSFYGANNVHEVGDSTILLDLTELLLRANLTALEHDTTEMAGSQHGGFKSPNLAVVLVFQLQKNSLEHCVIPCNATLNALWVSENVQQSMDWLVLKSEWNVHEIVEEVIVKLQPLIPCINFEAVHPVSIIPMEERLYGNVFYKHWTFSRNKPVQNLPVLNLLPCHTSTSDEADLEEDSTLQCNICLQSFQNDLDRQSLLPCKHSFCCECIKFHLGSQILQGFAVISCPKSNCHHTFASISMLHLLSLPFMLKFYLPMMTSRVFLSSHLQAYTCTHCGNHLQLLDHPPGQTADVHCLCGKAFCSRCNSEPHWPLPCTYNKFYVETLKSNGDHESQHGNALLESAILARGKSCPTCGMIVEKKGSSNRMLCSACNTSFCWKCNRSANDCNFNCTQAEKQQNNFFQLPTKTANSLKFPLKRETDAYELYKNALLYRRKQLLYNSSTRRKLKSLNQLVGKLIQTDATLKETQLNKDNLPSIMERQEYWRNQAEEIFDKVAKMCHLVEQCFAAVYVMKRNLVPGKVQDLSMYQSCAENMADCVRKMEMIYSQEASTGEVKLPLHHDVVSYFDTVIQSATLLLKHLWFQLHPPHLDEL